MDAARALAHALHNSKINLVYGGGTVGLMGEIARTLVSLSGPNSVHGIIPQALLKFDNLSETIEESVYGRTTIVQDMHTRKQLMAREVIAGGPGGGFVALSGGYGTFEELMEVTTWNQLGIHSMPVVIMNVNGYWSGLIEWVQKAVCSGFVNHSNAGILSEALTAEKVIECLKEYKNAPGRFQLTWAEQ
jgi:uncharacterized protein (TIGR00730 family)